MTQKLDLCLDKGTDFACVLLCVDCEGKFVDFAGYKAAMQIKQNIYGRVIDELTTENGRLEIDLERGSILMQFPNEVTASYPATKLIYDIVATSDTGFVFRLVEGLITVRAGVTM